MSVLLLVEFVEGTWIPSIVISLYLGSNPRITTLVPSPPLLISEIPGRRPIASAAFASGFSCNRSGATILTIVLELIYSLIASI